MCGIAGLLDWPFGSFEAAGQCARAMAGALAHRGPDGEGFWRSDDGRVHFAHRRLAIIDLSEAGAQPMTSADGRWTICFNGEIYNFSVLRAALEAAGAVLRGHSDTEALLETIARKGLEAALKASEGMFAFALWDAREGRLHLVRDRAGIKPLYWTKRGTGLAFSSELKALRLAPGASFALDVAQVSSFLRFGYVTAPATIFADVFKLPPATILSVGDDGAVSLRPYWSAWEAAAAPRDLRSETELREALDALVQHCVRQELVSDVPLGAFLSGGVDSSLVAAIAQRALSRPLKTFSVGFDDPSIDESAHAEAVARHIGTEHHAFRVTAAEALGVIPLLPEMYDEPVADIAQIPTYLVSKFARQHVTAALSGDGGDELFGGYDRYWTAESVWRKLAPAPLSARKLAAQAVRAMPHRMAAAVAAVAQPSMAPRRATARFARLATALEAPTPLSVYAATIELWTTPPAHAAAASSGPFARAAEEGDAVKAFQLIDLHTYLPDDVLAKVDRASMAASLEARVPLLNHKLMEFALRLPESAKRKDGRAKWLLREVLHRYVPRDLVDRPKQGFSTPMGAWLRGPLKTWAGDLLAERALAQSDVLAPQPILQRWREHIAGEADWSYALWPVLSFQAWRRGWREAPRVGD